MKVEAKFEEHVTFKCKNAKEAKRLSLLLNSLVAAKSCLVLREELEGLQVHVDAISSLTRSEWHKSLTSFLRENNVNIEEVKKHYKGLHVHLVAEVEVEFEDHATAEQASEALDKEFQEAYYAGDSVFVREDDIEENEVEDLMENVRKALSKLGFTLKEKE